MSSYHVLVVTDHPDGAQLVHDACVSLAVQLGHEGRYLSKVYAARATEEIVAMESQGEDG